MAFWSSEKFAAEAKELNLIDPYEDAALKHAAYELAIGDEAFVTSFADGTKRLLKEGDQLLIPPGQFGLLITKEVVKVPCTAIAFISIRASVKFRGLVNISGFHVDPGFEGKLKFSVYNAGSQPLVLDFGQRIFMIWYADLDQQTEDGYGGPRPEQNTLTAKNIEDLQGEIASPGALKILFDEHKKDCKNQIDSLKQDYEKRMAAFDNHVDTLKRTAWIVIAVFVGVLVTFLFNRVLVPQQSQVGTLTPAAPTTQSTASSIKKP